ncbi:hypothetical protein ABEV41_00240 [Geobacillus thermodenitrificans]|uniref:hypothetical protein n=1 Tax=Geobacillus thermodenitrificans TaxID=33940 RepID=UPI003D1D0A45
MTKKKKIMCTCCGKEKPDSEFYISKSPFHKATGRLHVCKQCMFDHVDEKDINTIKDVLRMVDKPWITELYKSSVEEAQKQNKSVFGMYMKNLGMPQMRDKTWAHSDSQQSIEDEVGYALNVDENLTEEDIQDLIKFWGRGFNIEDYLWLQNEYEDFVTRYECDSKSMELLIKQICLTELDIEKRRANGEKVDQQLKTLQELLGSSNLKPVQETGANAAENATFGTLIKKFENEKPIPEPAPEWQDVDGIRKYISVWFLGHLCRMLGIKNDYADMYEEEIKKYTVESPQYDEDKEGDS